MIDVCFAKMLPIESRSTTQRGGELIARVAAASSP
jgi:hypothetical protein